MSNPLRIDSLAYWRASRAYAANRLLHLVKNRGVYMPATAADNLRQRCESLSVGGTPLNTGNLAPEKTIRTYSWVLLRAVINLRMRIRCGESIDMQEVHDLLDAIHNIPEMICAYGGWHIEENINSGLQQYDSRWYKPDSTSTRLSLMRTLSEQTEGTAE